MRLCPSTGGRRKRAKEFAPTSGADFAVAQGEQQYGRLPVLLVRVNPDLAMGYTRLKATGAGNLFTVFGEPDISPDRTPEALVVEIRGLDVDDVTTCAVRSSTTDDIACWFRDTDYKEESLFVRHADFTGADEPYAGLQRACGPRGTKGRGPRSTGPAHGPSRCHPQARSRSRS